MDFLDLTSYSPTDGTQTFPDTYKNTYPADSYVPDYSFNNYENDGFFDGPITVDPTFWSSSQSPVDQTLDSRQGARTSSSAFVSDANVWSTLHSTPFGDIGDLSKAFATTAPIKTSTSPCLSPHSLSHHSSLSDPSDHPSSEEATTTPPPRKRGRPRLHRNPSGSSERILASDKIAHPQRVPHTQVERKYREGLNTELERLRRAVPTLLQSQKADVIGAAKPSKAMVLAAAIEYIKTIERERDEALFEVQRLGGGVKRRIVGSL